MNTEWIAPTGPADVFERLVAQGRPARTGGICSYYVARPDGPLRCAIGHCWPPAVAKQAAIHGAGTWRNLAPEYLDELPDWTKDDDNDPGFPIGWRMQIAHDSIVWYPGDNPPWRVVLAAEWVRLGLCLPEAEPS